MKNLLQTPTLPPSLSLSLSSDGARPKTNKDATARYIVDSENEIST